MAWVIENKSIWTHTHRIMDNYVPAKQVEATLERMHGEPRVVLEIKPRMITSWSPPPGDREVRHAD